MFYKKIIVFLALIITVILTVALLILTAKNNKSINSPNIFFAPKDQFCMNYFLEECDGKRVKIIGTLNVGAKAAFLEDIMGRMMTFSWLNLQMLEITHPASISDELDGKRMIITGVITAGHSILEITPNNGKEENTEIAIESMRIIERPAEIVTLTGPKNETINPGPVEEDCGKHLKNYADGIDFLNKRFNQCEIVESKLAQGKTNCPGNFSMKKCYICELKCQ